MKRLKIAESAVLLALSTGHAASAANIASSRAVAQMGASPGHTRRTT
jgi:hypothetical protein